MTLRNRHDRTHDHDGTLSLDDVEIEELEGYPAGTLLADVLAAMAAQVEADAVTRAFTANATLRSVREWPRPNTALALDAIIGSGLSSPLTYPGFFTLAATKGKTQSGTFTANAVIV